MRIKGFCHRTLPLKLYDLASYLPMMQYTYLYVAISTGLIYNIALYVHMQILCKHSRAPVYVYMLHKNSVT